MEQTLIARLWSNRDRPGWRSFGIAMLVLSGALLVALFSAAAAQQGRVGLAAITTVISLGLAAWVAIVIVPTLARRTSLRWLVYQVDYRLTREGIIYLVAVFILVIAAVNTGNNLLFMFLACSLAGILISGVLSRVVLTGVDLKFDMPEHIFAEQPVLAELELRNEKQTWPSFSLRVAGENKKGAAEILSRPVFFPYIPRRSAARQKVELVFPRRGVYHQDTFAIRTRFPFGFFEKSRKVDSQLEIVVYPRVAPTDQFYEVLPLLSGEMASHFRGRGHELHSLRDYLHTDSARFVDWKVTAKAGRLMVREYAREDERRVMLVLDPVIGPPRTELLKIAEAENAARFERAVTMAACIAWHFNEINSVMQFRTNRFVTAMAPAGEIIYETLRELANLKPDHSSVGGTFFDDLAADREIFKIIVTNRSQHSVPSALWSSSYFLFIDQL
ncbi:MAG TPA: DUF58 domain-containing protein [Candidatus Acidoferrales bacterium]|jgi:hypothetical protein|nr:DUF58 domain-containing protein [Candidatus Acidoferrales bacterium]